MTGLWPQNFWLGTHPSSGSVHDASLSKEPGWVRSCLPSDERHVGFWMESDSRPPLEHLFAKICFSVISSILSFFFCFSFRKDTINIEALYCFIGFCNKRKITPNSGTQQITFLLSFFHWSCSVQQGLFCIWLHLVSCSMFFIISLLIVNGCKILYQLDTS